ncbi:Rieske (2Fe-2S) protein [Rhodococcus pyridinivorans]|uniref:Cytochrome bc1 complex Rieske iron-sulfur subunit n=2 Tax=Rhodococcus pyridinivorans TaxID=103816 RepID=A0A7T7LG02_9NOCA|nr:MULTISPECIES: Rieske (2Fe-2S) protein [Rhodococcus]APE10180.1 (2Fe-2S)-binding protein [Rhodococcus sp. 2G]EHK83429.1 Rieske (2Fe-2S) domain-containing protein [Rhodococcus pyridinivorans AK37]KHJ72186.1 (2Fe-2S)-binding protein [Rhodococcus sp. Chr-9]MBX4169133.1 Rieske (2Fe-2S) protein [Rhodococcus sp. DMU2021]MCD2116446.1 Rieske (2Fe-2S) protein [Rhodococcus pyridinivorans]
MSSDNLDRTALTRRTLIGGAGVVAAGAALTACGSSGDTGEARSAVPAPTTTAPPGPDAEVVAAVADVPVGGGVMLESKRLVVTQPAEGDFRAFIAICTHQGCNLSGVEDDRIICPCHGSRYDLDGAPVEGPAKRPLKTRPVAARGSDLVVG